MSDSDDGFDEEAVREELREKYEDEREDREATARMSELLLQGATMTNDHCDRCGSPLFRDEGQTFCPTCQHEAQRQQAAAGQPDDAQQAPAETQQPARDQQAAGQQGGDQQPPADAASGTPSRRAPPSQSGGSEPAPDTGRRGGRSGGRSRDAAPAREDDPSTRDLPEHAPTASATGPAADALESTVAALARRAGSADDPRTAREYLEAAREAAEALAVLRQ